ncbi:sulfate ABC transporter substrate-binding protein [Paenibacillus camelliae]|uniref:sulfate ABC transporter substrate-binding protein n=1 Tax=Paenibacillus camelliae TaxID=512410 RepID=UPI002042487A|nr:sulfate ABC transporter substrate-binding protein [Paenibacillus camelliae]MCM3634440.1 sulfate ABC transporter substrate-binding protein [Paenibacillus camelliae]
MYIRSIRQFLLLFSAVILMVGLLVACGQGNGNNSNELSSSNKVNSNGKEESKSKESNEQAKAKDAVKLLNVSYDPTRELYVEFNEAFAKHWKETANQEVTIEQSHGGSGKQGRAVIDGLEADVVTLALGYDIDAIVDAGLIEPDWQSQYELNSSPYTSTIVFLVRKGNPKNIIDWDDLIKEDVEVITPNPKTSGGARWNYLAAWGYALKQNNNDEEAAKQYVAELFKHVPVLDTGARGSTTTFVEREIGDVLLAWENEAYLSINELGPDKFDIVYPSLSILAEPPVAIVDKVVDKRGTREVAEAYLQFLYTDEGQKIAGKNYYRPTNQAIAEQFNDQFPKLELLQIDEDFGGWKAAQEKHFAEGGLFDQIYTPGS